MLGDRDGGARKFLRKFLVFSYKADNTQFVEAYPVHHGGTLASTDTHHTYNLPLDISWAIIEAPSRTQARKWAYRKWIDESGDGFKTLPLSIHHMRRGVIA